MLSFITILYLCTTFFLYNVLHKNTLPMSEEKHKYERKIKRDEAGNIIEEKEEEEIKAD